MFSTNNQSLAKMGKALPLRWPLIYRRMIRHQVSVRKAEPLVNDMEPGFMISNNEKLVEGH